MNQFEQDVISRANEKLASLLQQDNQTVEKTASPFTDAAVGSGLGALSSVGGGLMGRTIGDLLSSTGLGAPSEEDLQKYPDLRNPLPDVMQTAGSLALPLTIGLLHGGKSSLAQSIPFALGSLGASDLLAKINQAATATIDPKGYSDMLRSIDDAMDEDEALANLA